MSTQYNEMAKKDMEMTQAVREGKMSISEYENWYNNEFQPVIAEMSKSFMQDQIDSMSEEEAEDFNKTWCD